MKKITNPIRIETNKRSLARWAFTVVGLAFLLTGTSALAAPPANDNFANAEVISASPPATVTGNNTDATVEVGELSHSPSEALGGRSVWWSWTPATSGSVTITTGGSGLDTQLAVYTGNSVTDLTLIANNEDSILFDGGRSAVSITAFDGTQYFIAVDGFNGGQGNINLNFSTGTITNPPTGLALTINTTGNGTVTRDPEKASYDTNDVVTLTATPNGTNTFLGWGGDASAEGTNNPIQVTMDATKTVTAAFTGDGIVPPPTNGFTSIVVLTNGNGRVSPNLNGKNNLKVGKSYTITAKPGKDQVFAGWTGAPLAANTSSSKLTFIMEPGLTITASFVPNPFIAANVVGTYNGLLTDAGDTNGINQDCSGEFNIKVSKNGSFSGQLVKGGVKMRTSGTFLPDGTVTGAPVSKGASAGTLNLQLDMLTQTDRITGLFISSNCVANVEGDRQVFSSKNPTPLEGKYTLVFPRDPLVINGNGYASISVNKSGKVTTKGELADGTKISDSSVVSTNGQVPIYISLYKNTGSLMGWLNLSATNASGLFSWIKPALTNGFEIDVNAIGSPFSGETKPYLVLSNGIAEIGGDGLVDVLLIPGVVDDKNNFVVDGTNNVNNLKLKLSSNGFFKGTFDNPATLRKDTVKGVILQNVNSAAGYFSGSTGPGYIEIHDEAEVIIVEPPVIEEPVLDPL